MKSTILVIAYALAIAFYVLMITHYLPQTRLWFVIRRIRKPRSMSTIASKEKGRPRPPINAEYVLHLLLTKDERISLPGDLTEEYADIVQHFGKTRADIWYCKQVLGSLAPLLRRAIVRLAHLFGLPESCGV